MVEKKKTEKNNEWTPPNEPYFERKIGKFGEIDSADTCAGKFPLVPMGGWAEGPACADMEARTPIGASGSILLVSQEPMQKFKILRQSLLWFE